jgi:hypothetical protein
LWGCSERSGVAPSHGEACCGEKFQSDQIVRAEHDQYTSRPQTATIYNRHAISNENDLREAVRKLEAANGV